MSKQQTIAKQVMRMNRQYEVQFMPSVLTALRTKLRQVVAIVKAGGDARSWLRKDIGNTALAMAVRTLYRYVGVRHANRVYEKLMSEPKVMQQKRFGFNANWSREVIDYLQAFLLEKITFDVNATTRTKLLKVLTEAVEDGLSVDETVERLTALSKENGWLRFQAARIVRTEVKRAAEVGGRVASNAFEYEQNKEWVSILDNRTRGRDPEDHADHVRMNGQVVDANGSFIDPRDNTPLLFPGDPKAPASDTINCRCTAVYIAKRDPQGRLIPKSKTNRQIERV